MAVGEPVLLGLEVKSEAGADKSLGKCPRPPLCGQVVREAGHRESNMGCRLQPPSMCRS